MKKLPGMVVRALEVGPFMSNCYIVGSEKTKEGMVVDPGADITVDGHGNLIIDLR